MPIDIIKEPRDKEYERLIQYAFETCKTFVLAMERQILMYYGEPEILKRLEPYKVNESKEFYYYKINYYSPDTILYFYECNENTNSIIMSAVMGLYEWRSPRFPEDLTFFDDKDNVWMGSISHEHMAGINERNREEVEFIKNNIGLEIYWIEKVYTDAEVMGAITELRCLVDAYFALLRSSEAKNLDKILRNKKNSEHYGYWNEYFEEYDINEHCLALEIARLGKLLKLDDPIYAYDFSNLLNDLQDTSYLELHLSRNLDCNPELLYKFLEDFNQKYKKK